jgi:hypothetical protein
MVLEKLRHQSDPEETRHIIFLLSVWRTRHRLAEIQLEDLDEVLRFVIGNLLRLYGFRIAEVAFILWSGSDHKNLA